MESKDNSHTIDLDKVRMHWKAMLSEREKERKLMSKLVQELRKALATVGNLDKLESLFKYLT